MNDIDVLDTLEKIKSRLDIIPVEMTSYETTLLLQEREMLLKIAIMLEKENTFLKDNLTAKIANKNKVKRDSL